MSLVSVTELITRPLSKLNNKKKKIYDAHTVKQ